METTTMRGTGVVPAMEKALALPFFLMVIGPDRACAFRLRHQGLASSGVCRQMEWKQRGKKKTRSVPPVSSERVVIGQNSHRTLELTPVSIGVKRSLQV
jgi:hypothetical protein